jgi:hypothetical protein
VEVYAVEVSSAVVDAEADSAVVEVVEDEVQPGVVAADEAVLADVVDPVEVVAAAVVAGEVPM